MSHTKLSTASHWLKHGKVKQRNRILLSHLSVYLCLKMVKWDSYLDQFAKTCKKSKHKSTRIPPNKLITKRESHLLLHLFSLKLPQKSLIHNKNTRPICFREKKLRRKLHQAWRRQKHLFGKRSYEKTLTQRGKVIFLWQYPTGREKHAPTCTERNFAILQLCQGRSNLVHLVKGMNFLLGTRVERFWEYAVIFPV